MKLKFLILLVITFGLCSGQDSLRKDSISSHRKLTHEKPRNRNKNKPLKKENATYAIFKEKVTDANNIKEDTQYNTTYNILSFLILTVVVTLVFKYLNFEVNGKGRTQYDRIESSLSEVATRTFMSRRDYYRNVYLKSDAWERKRYVVLKRDNWRCVRCGAHATQVHHKRYAPKNIGKEPIGWLESLCKSCHESLHR